MTELDQALAEISAIRTQIARTIVFRGYGPATLAGTGALAFGAAVVQAMALESPAAQPLAYLTLWIGTAVVCASIVGAEMITRTWRAHSGLEQEMLWTALEQFAPSAAAGALLTAVVFRYAPESIWMLPGLWQIVASLGVFASGRFLPRSIAWVGAWYLLAGLTCLAVARGDLALSPWAMGIPFGCGQLFAAAILFVTLEEGDGEA